MDLLISVNSDILSSYAERKKEARGTEDCDTDSDYERGCSLEQEKEEFIFGQRTNQSFERGAIYFINNHQNFSGGNASPLRSSSFDLLFLLTMQEAIHRLLRSYKDAGEEKEISFAWLNELYKKSLSKYFDGSHVGFGRSEEFLDEILSTSPALKTVGDKVGKSCMVYYDHFFILFTNKIISMLPFQILLTLFLLLKISYPSVKKLHLNGKRYF